MPVFEKKKTEEIMHILKLYYSCFQNTKIHNFLQNCIRWYNQTSFKYLLLEHLLVSIITYNMYKIYKVKITVIFKLVFYFFIFKFYLLKFFNWIYLFRFSVRYVNAYICWELYQLCINCSIFHYYSFLWLNNISFCFHY